MFKTLDDIEKEKKKALEEMINLMAESVKEFYEQFKQLPKNEQFARIKIHTHIFDLLTICRELDLTLKQSIIFIRNRLKGKKIESFEPYLSKFEKNLKLGATLQMEISEHEVILKNFQKIYEN